MAEGIQISSLNSQYFCHHCTREVLPYHTAELICPDCSSSFLEEVSKDLYEAENMGPNYDQDEYIYEPDDDAEDIPFFPEISMDRLISQMLMNVASVHRPPGSGDNLSRSDSLRDLIRHPSLLNAVDGDADLQHLSAWSVVDDVDAIASQLLDEVELDGPPPLSKEQMKALATVVVTPEDIERGVQCTICMDDFSLREKAKQLPCRHLYHEKCINPWLEKQATCPNCRDIIEIQTKSKRSKSCPRPRLNSRSGDSRRLSDSPASTLTNFFTTSRNPFRFLN